MWSWWLAGRARLEWEEQPEIIKRVRKSCSEQQKKRYGRRRMCLARRYFSHCESIPGHLADRKETTLNLLNSPKMISFSRVLAANCVRRAFSSHNDRHSSPISSRRVRRRKLKLNWCRAAAARWVRILFFTDQKSQVQHENRIYETFKFKLRNWPSIFF